VRVIYSVIYRSVSVDWNSNNRFIFLSVSLKHDYMLMSIPTAQPACRPAISRTLSEHTSIILQYVNWESLTNNRLWNRDVRKTEILFGFGY